MDTKNDIIDVEWTIKSEKLNLKTHHKINIIMLYGIIFYKFGCLILTAITGNLY